MKELENKLYRNSIILEKVVKLSKEERQKVICKLLQTNTERGLAKELEIPQSTIHDWKTLRQDNTGVNMHVSLDVMFRKLKRMTPRDVRDWGRLEQIKEVVDNLLRAR